MAAKHSTLHPFAAIEHRVLDSPAYIALPFSAQSLLMLLVRQLNGKNNGRLQATLSYLEPRGFSDRTITRGIKDLIAAGLIYRTRCGGFNNGASLYAVTWLPIGSQRDGLFLAGFKACAWRDWQPAENKTPPANLRTCSRKNGGLPGPTTDKFTAVPSAKFTDNELLPRREAPSHAEKGFDFAFGPRRSGGTFRLPVLAGGRMPPLDSRTWHCSDTTAHSPTCSILERVLLVDRRPTAQTAPLATAGA